MKPSEKAPAIDEALREIFGIDRKGSIERNQCVFCPNPLENFRDEQSEREAMISGLCQACQDKTFKEER